jgi:two-component system nitrogen regulation response regulator GlnG
MTRLPVIADDPLALSLLAEPLPQLGLLVTTASTLGQGIEQIKRQRPDAVLLHQCLAKNPGLEALDRLRALDSELPILLTTDIDSSHVAIEAARRGAHEFLPPLVLPQQILVAVHQALAQSRAGEGTLALEAVEPETQLAGLVGRCAAMRAVYSAIGQVAPRDVPVLVLGESGTGKELVAKAIHQHSHRASGPFVPVNSAAIAETLLESELFGHEKGAFTSADRRRVGKFEQADQGTLFLDEIGDMALPVQVKLLRLLQEQRFERVGGSKTIQTDVRLVAATNQDLDQLAREGRFRSDLLYRLRVFTISLPPLRERPGDLGLLVSHFVQVVGEKMGKRVRALDAEAWQLLESYSWPGNVRELQGALKHALVVVRGETLTLGCLPTALRAENLTTARKAPAVPEFVSEVVPVVRRCVQAGERGLHGRLLGACERTIVLEALRLAGGDRMRAAVLLGMSRTRLWRRLRALGIQLEKKKEPA